MQHKFIKADTGRGFACFCYGCGKSQWAGEVEGGPVVWADLNGPAFKAYYCDDCKADAERKATA